jgi:hypothetical protein
MQGQQNHANHEQKVNKGTRHPVYDKSNQPKHDQNPRDNEQHHVRRLSGETLNPPWISKYIQRPRSSHTNISKKLATLNSIEPSSENLSTIASARMTFLPYKKLRRKTVQKGTLLRIAIPYVGSASGITRHEDHPQWRPEETDLSRLRCLLASPIGANAEKMRTAGISRIAVFAKSRDQPCVS